MTSIGDSDYFELDKSAVFIRSISVELLKLFNALQACDTYFIAAMVTCFSKFYQFLGGVVGGGVTVAVECVNDCPTYKI